MVIYPFDHFALYLGHGLIGCIAEAQKLYILRASSKHMHKCRICGNSDNNKTFEVKEMNFGFRDLFIYFQCSECKCLQISEIPQNMFRYYPKAYYSYNTIKSNFFSELSAKFRNSYALFDMGFIGKLLYLERPYDALRYFAKFKLNKNSKILDVGCGSGRFLYELKDLGFSDLTGLDLYIETDIKYGNKIRILKKDIHSISGNWDLIYFNHSFEHLPDPLDVFRSIEALLSDNGFCVIRIPIVSSYAWEHYGTNWVQLDAPRHFFLHSIESIKLLAGRTKLSLAEINYISNDFQFWGSEQYTRGIPLNSEKSFIIDPTKSIFTSEQIAEFKQLAKELNANAKGDTAEFVLQKCT